MLSRLNEEQRIAQAEAFFAATGADIRHGGDSAHYVPSQDYIQMPPFESFRDATAFYGTLGHEAIHWTRHPSRLNRDFGQKRFGDQAYAVEELVAELGAAFLCADLELVPQIRDDHAPYIAGWPKALKNDKRAIFTAASHAQKAVDYLHSLQPPVTADGEAEEQEERAAWPPLPPFPKDAAMRKPDIMVIDGRAYSWSRLLELRRAQLEAWRAAQARQPALFDLKDDSRPAAERSAAGRYSAPTLLTFLQDRP